MIRKSVSARTLTAALAFAAALACVLPVASAAGATASANTAGAAAGTLDCSVQSDGVHVSWGAAAGANSYNIYRKTGTGAFVLLGNTALTTWTDGTAASGNTYTYRVITVVHGHEGATVGDCVVATVPFFPTPLALGLAGVGTIGAIVVVRKLR
jgi:hypothetical protein